MSAGIRASISGEHTPALHMYTSGVHLLCGNESAAASNPPLPMVGFWKVTRDTAVKNRRRAGL